MPRGAAQAGLTEGAEQSLKFAWKRMSKTKTSRRLHHLVFQGRALRGRIQAPLGWGAENAGKIGGCSEGRAGAAFPSENSRIRVWYIRGVLFPKKAWYIPGIICLSMAINRCGMSE
jgi:hypothetical protein